MNRNCILRAAACLGILLGVGAGCASSSKPAPPGPTPKEIATQNWNTARATVLFSLAKDQYQSGNFDKCAQTIDEALKMDPKCAGLHVLSARLNIELSQLERADRELAIARTLDPKDAEADFLDGVIYQRWQQPARALAFYEQASKKKPAELSFVLAKAEMLVSLNRSGEALALLQDKVVYFEHSPAIRDEVGQLLADEHRYPEAIAMFRQAAILTPDDLTIKEHLAFSLFYNHAYCDADQVLMDLLKDEHYSQRADLTSILGECQLEEGHSRDARDTCQRACDLNRGSASALRSLAEASLQCHDLGRAEGALKKAQEIEGASAETSLLMGYLRIHEGRLNEALIAFREVSRQNPTDPLGLCMTGYVLEKLGHGDQAIECYGEALKLKPNDELATRLLASAQHD